MAPQGVERFLADYRDADVTSREAVSGPDSSTARASAPQPPRCQKCGVWKDQPGRPYDDPNSICYSFTGYMGAPEPNGDHEWPVEDRDDCAECGAYPAAKNDDGDYCYPLSTRDGSDPTAGVCGWCARELLGLL